MYEGRSWQLSSEHILYTLGHMKFMLKDFPGAAEYFNLLMGGVVGAGHLQQMVHLREYFLVHHARAKEDKSVAVVTLPRLHSQQTRVVVGVPAGVELLRCWHQLERAVRAAVTGQVLSEKELLHRTVPHCSGPALAAGHLPASLL